MTAGRIRRIVAVDDDERTLRLLVDALGSETQRVLTFGSGELVLSFLVDAEACDLLVLDVEMPGIDGFAVARAVRRMPHLASMPILALTGRTGPDDAVRLLEAGADAYRSKPVEIDELRTLVAGLLSSTADVAPAETHPPGSGDAAPRGNGELLLVVDDDAQIRALASELLGDAGYLVVTAATGEEALRRIEGIQFDLVVTDMHMPGMDGASLHAAIGERWPSLQRRVVFVTGDVDADRLACGDVRSLQKPFGMAALQRAIRDALDAEQ